MIPHVARLNWNNQRERRKWRKRIREKEAPRHQGSPQQRPVEESSLEPQLRKGGRRDLWCQSMMRRKKTEGAPLRQS